MNQSIYQFLEHYRLFSEKVDPFFLSRIGSAFSNLPYENVTKILKVARSQSTREKFREAEEVLAEHLRWNTGGTCFSLCNALLAVLKDTGFEAFIAMADMNYGRNIHCAVVAVFSECRFLLDPGYLLHEPLPLPENKLEITRLTPMNTVILRNEKPDVYSLFTHESGETKWRYRLYANPVPRAEFEQHWVRSFSLNTMEQIMLSRLSRDGRIYFRKDRLELVSSQNRSKRILSPGASHELSSLFGVPADLITLADRLLSGRPESRPLRLQS